MQPVTKLTPDMKAAFRFLGVSPGSGPAKIRSAWKAMVRAYHPDQVAEDKAEANRRLSEINAAFDLLSAWSPEDAQAYVAARAKQRAAQDATARESARKAEAKRKKAKDRADELRQRRAAARADAEKATRHCAEAQERKEAAARVKTHAPIMITARTRFLAAMCELAPLCPARDFGFV